MVKEIKGLGGQIDIKQMTDPGYFTKVARMLSGPEVDKAQAALRDFFNEPVEKISQNRKRLNPKLINQAVLPSVNRLHDFSKWLLEMHEQGETELIMNTVQSYYLLVSLHPQENRVMIDDVVSVAGDLDLGGIGKKAYEALDVMVAFEAEFVPVNDIDPEKALISQEARLFKILNKKPKEIGQDPMPELLLVTNNLVSAVLGRGVITADVKPVEFFEKARQEARGEYFMADGSLMAFKALLIRLRGLLAEKKNEGLDGLVVKLANTSLLFCIWNGNYHPDRKKQLRMAKESMVRLYGKAAQKYPEIWLNEGSFDCMVNNLLDFDGEKAANARKQSQAKILTGMGLLDDDGNHVDFDLKSEEWIRQIGISKLSFKEAEAGVQVKVMWFGRTIEFLLDRGCQPIGLEELSEPAKDRLLSFIFAYLEDIVSIEESLIKPEADKEKTGTKEKIEPRCLMVNPGVIKPYLRVLSLGHKSHVDEKSQAMGVKLGLLNRLFDKLQSNEHMLNEGILQDSEFDGLSRDLQLKYFSWLMAGVQRTAGRIEGVQWRVKSDGRVTTNILYPSSDQKADRYGFKKYQFTRVNGYKAPEYKGKSVQVRCPAAAGGLKYLEE